MSLAPLKPEEIEEKFDEIDDVLDDHGKRLNNLEESFGAMEKKLIDIETGLVKMEHNYLQGNALILQAYQTQSQEHTKLMGMILESVKNKNNNNTNIILKIIGSIGVLIGTFFAGKNLN